MPLRQPTSDWGVDWPIMPRFKASRRLSLWALTPGHSPRGVCAYMVNAPPGDDGHRHEPWRTPTESAFLDWIGVGPPLDASDRLVKIDVPKSLPPLPLAGNRDFLLYEQAGLLVREYYDSSERKKPLTEYFRWRNGKFQFERLEKAPVFEAGFDCRKARSDAEITICGHEDLAVMDRELGERYQEILKTISPAWRYAFVSGQKKWLQNRNSRCTHKWIRECLSDMYRDRLKELDALPGRRKK